jgi:uncharacterized RDD family membrane protein YckC
MLGDERVQVHPTSHLAALGVWRCADTGRLSVRDTGAVTARHNRARPAPGTADGAIVTGEAVPLEIRVAGLGSRALALLLDLLIQVVLFMVLWMMALIAMAMLELVGLIDEALVIAMSIVVTALVLVGYPTAMLALTGGRTLGKMALGLRVVRDDGGPISLRHAATRSFVGVAVEFPALLLPGGWVISIASMLGSRLSKRVGDHAAGTFVIHERNLQSWGWVPAMPPELAGWAARLDLAGLDDNLALATRHFLSRNRHLREPARTQLGLSLARQVAEVIQLPPPAGTPGWAYLAAVHAERHTRAMRRLASERGRAGAVWPELVAATAPPLPPAATGVTTPVAEPLWEPRGFRTPLPAQPDSAARWSAR